MQPSRGARQLALRHMRARPLFGDLILVVAITVVVGPISKLDAADGDGASNTIA